jgi:hypothetical protein
MSLMSQKTHLSPRAMQVQKANSRVATRLTVAHAPGFPVKFSGFDALYATFLTESRTRCSQLGPRTGNPGQAVFGLEWGTYHSQYGAI